MKQIMLGNIAMPENNNRTINNNSRVVQNNDKPRQQANKPRQQAANYINRQQAQNAQNNKAVQSAAGKAQHAVTQCKQKRKKRRGNFTIHYILFVLLCLAAFATLSVTVLFNTTNIYVDGIDKYSQEQIIEKSGIKIGDNLIKMKTSEISKKLIEGFSYIKKVEVKRMLPSTVKIQIVQAVPVTALEIGEKYAIVDIDSKVLETNLDVRPEGLYLLRGIKSDKIIAGQALPDECKEQFVMFGYLKSAIDAGGFDKIDWIDVSNRLNMRIMYDNRLVIELGSEAQLEYKLSFVKGIIDNNLEPNAEGVIDTARIKEKEVRFRNEDVHKSTVQALHEQKADVK